MAGAMGLQPVAGPQVWHGSAMATRQDWIRPLHAVEAPDTTGIDIAAIRLRDLQLPELQPLVEEVRQAVLHGRGMPLSAPLDGSW